MYSDISRPLILTPQFHGRIISHIRRRRSPTDISTGISQVCSLTALSGDRNKTSYYAPILFARIALLLARIALRELISEKFQ